MSTTRNVMDPRCLEAPEVREVKDEAGTRGFEIRFAVAADPQGLLSLFWDVKHFSRLFPDIKEFAVVGSGGGEPPTSLDVSYRIDVVVKELRYVLRRVLHREAGTITWTELSGDLRRVRGGWSVRAAEIPGVSLVIYRAFVDVGRFVPSSLVAKAAKRKAGEMVERVRQVAFDIASGEV